MLCAVTVFTNSYYMHQAAACTHGVMVRSYSVCIDLLPGSTLKIHGESISPSQPTTTVLLSSEDTAEYAVKVALERYHIEKEDPANYCLVQVRDAPLHQATDCWVLQGRNTHTDHSVTVLDRLIPAAAHVWFVYCLQVMTPPEAQDLPPGLGPNQHSIVLDDDDCPLAILLHHPPNEGRYSMLSALSTLCSSALL